MIDERDSRRQDANRTRRLVFQLLQFDNRHIEFLKGGSKSRQQVKTCIRKRDAACCAVKQPDPEPPFQDAYRLAHGGWSEPELLCGSDEAAHFRHGGKSFELSKFASLPLDYA